MIKSGRAASFSVETAPLLLKNEVMAIEWEGNNEEPKVRISLGGTTPGNFP